MLIQFGNRTMKTRLALLLFAYIFTSIAAAANAAPSAEPNYQPTVLITGSNRGIGFEFARQFAERNWNVIATARNPADAVELHELAKGHAVAIEQLDVTNKEHIAALAAKYADTPIDILLLNAAKGPQQPTATASLKRQDYDVAPDYFAINAIGPMRVTQAFMENVKASEKKRVIVISSDSGSFVAGSQLPILSHYKASKAALNMYFHTLAFETRRRGVTVVMIHPGNVATNPNTARLPGAIPTTVSVGHMLKVIDGLTLEDNGRFVDFNGGAMPW
jgi:NAD(P)-dependent dehydrogenase (short-subunit alcohol dehydrogenase family)